MNQYRVYIDISKVKDELKELGLTHYVKDIITIKLNAEDPDEVCSVVADVLYELIRSDRRAKSLEGDKKTKLSTYLKAASLIKENYRITKIKLVKKDV